LQRMTMTLNEYQELAFNTAMDSAKNPAYMIANLTSEAGEVAGKYAKWIRDGVLDEVGMQKEAGDVLWQLAGLSTVMGWSLADVASQNLRKLAERQANNTLKGSGDDR
jgi:NTP pyrophosphatase (non-canonical NTP hydrolase)